MSLLKPPLLLLLLYIFSSAVQASTCGEEKIAQTCLTVKVKAPNSQPLAEIIVYVEPLDGQITVQSKHTISIAQQHKSFSPYLTVSQTNQTINFSNLDDITHHIYSVSDNNKFSFKIRAGKKHVKQNFEQSAEIAMGCNIHDWMSGYLLVVDTPYFEKTNQLGEVNIPLLVSGNYRIVIWHPQLSTPNNRMIIEKNITQNSMFTFTLQKSIAEIPKQENEDDFDFLSDY